MLVCNVSQRQRRSITVEIIEATATAADAYGDAGIAVLLDEPATASEIILDAYLGELLAEAASAIDTIDAGQIVDVLIDEPANAIDEIWFPQTFDVALLETVIATADASASIGAPPGATLSEVIAGVRAGHTAIVSVDSGEQIIAGVGIVGG